VGVESDRTVFPVSVDAVRLYGPQPPATSLVTCTAHLTGLTDTGMRSDATLRTPDGGSWCQIDGWETRRFATDERIWSVKFAPEIAGVGESQLGGWCLVGERWPGTASRELMMRRYLNAAERAEYDGLYARRQRQWLLGRIAAKDAVRHWMWEQGHGPVFPCEITVSNDPTGQPQVTGPFAADLRVSIAHSGELGVALVSPDGAVGIDVEAVDDRALDTERIGFTAAEHRLLDSETEAAGHGAHARTTALVRFWAAKEAVAKARGTGFLGNPRNFEVTAKTGDVLDIVTGGDRYQATTQLIDGPSATYAVAWTTPFPTEAPE
jgi:phosphopantetheine--protein transferase-like protein